MSVLKTSSFTNSFYYGMKLQKLIETNDQKSTQPAVPTSWPSVSFKIKLHRAASTVSKLMEFFRQGNHLLDQKSADKNILKTMKILQVQGQSKSTKQQQYMFSTNSQHHETESEFFKVNNFFFSFLVTIRASNI